MNWYSGSIPDAIAEVKNCQKMLLVFVVGEDDLSKQMAESYDDSSVANKLNSNNCVALKLVVNSVPYQQFSQIYPVVVIPSSYFIGKNGHPIEVISGSLEPAKLVEKIEEIFQYESQVSDGPPSSHDASVVQEEVIEPMESSDIDNCATVQNGCENSNRPSTSNAEAIAHESETNTAEKAESSGDSAPLEDRVERAKLLIEVRRQNKAVEEQEDWVSSSARKKCVSSFPVAETGRKRMKVEESEEMPKERQEEQERRKVGKALQKAIQTRQENELKEWAENRAKEKEEERLARERVRAQIAQDRAERAAKYQQSKADEAAAQKAKDIARQKEEQEKASRDAAMRSTMARLQFRLPNGTSVTHQFSADATLGDARDFVLEEIRPSFAAFTLCTTFPRRHFTEANYSETLRSLELAPSAAILVLPGQPVTVANREGGFFGSIFWMLVSPLLAVWRAISSIFHRSSPPQAENQTPEPEPGPSGVQDADGSPPPRRRDPKQEQKFYREGNIYRINNRPTDDEDDNNTWNGNSTQQM